MQTVHEIRSFLLLPYLEDLERKGGNPDRLVAAFGLRREEIGGSYHKIPFARFLNIIQAIADRTEDKTLGLRLGAEVRADQVGSLSIMMSTSVTLGEALQQFAKWAQSMREGWSLELISRADSADYVYRILVPNAPVRHDVEYSIANLCSIIRTRMGTHWRPQEVHFRHALLGDSRHYERVFRCPIYFEQSEDKIVISPHDVARTGAHVNRALRPLIDAHFMAIEVDNPNAKLADRVVLKVAQHLGHKPVTIELIAAELGLSVRTLQRRLTEEGTNLRTILQDQRRALAEGILIATRRGTVTDVAIRAGYSDPSALSRAFKRWTGASPKKLAMKRHRAGLGGTPRED